MVEPTLVGAFGLLWTQAGDDDRKRGAGRRLDPVQLAVNGASGFNAFMNP